MKYIQILRHAPKHAHGALTDEGRAITQALKSKLPKFNLAISTNRTRAIETAKLLTGKEPKIDKRGAPPFTFDEEKKLHELGQNHPFGIAGVIFSNPQYRNKIKKSGYELVDLIKETLKSLPENGKGLIISHDGVMVSAYKILKKDSFDKANKTIKPLQGFQVNERMKIVDM